MDPGLACPTLVLNYFNTKFSVQQSPVVFTRIIQPCPGHQDYTVWVFNTRKNAPGPHDGQGVMKCTVIVDQQNEWNYPLQDEKFHKASNVFSTL